MRLRPFRSSRISYASPYWYCVSTFSIQQRSQASVLVHQKVPPVEIATIQFRALFVLPCHSTTDGSHLCCGVRTRLQCSLTGVTTKLRRLTNENSDIRVQISGCRWNPSIRGLGAAQRGRLIAESNLFGSTITPNARTFLACPRPCSAPPLESFKPNSSCGQCHISAVLAGYSLYHLFHLTLWNM